jgi:hypothetical protein
MIKTMKNLILVLFAVLVAACQGDSARLSEELRPEDSEASGSGMEAGVVVDSFYTALTGRDSAGVVSLFHPEGRLMGTDPAEDWGLDEIKAYMGDRLRDTTPKTVFRLMKRSQREWEGTSVVVDEIELSTLKVPFRVVTLVRKDQDSPCIVLSEFSALVPNANMAALEKILSSTQP